MTFNILTHNLKICESAYVLNKNTSYNNKYLVVVFKTMTFSQEFQAVVLAAGKASRMPEITAGKPKCLLPIGNKPLIWFSLYKLQQSGFEDAIVVVLENQKNEIQAALEKTDLEIRIDYFSIPANEDLGTADSLRMLNDKIRSDVLIFSCDLITDINLKGILDMFRKHNASVVAALIKPQHLEQLVVPGPKSKHKPERDLIGVDANTNRLVFLASASDFEGELSLPRNLLKKHTNITMHSNLVDSHIYVIKKWVVKYVQLEKSISTIKGELLPHIIKKQLAKPPKTVETNVSIVNNTNGGDIFHFAQESKLDLLIRDTSSFNDHIGDLKPSYHDDCIRCYAFIANPSVYGVRVNTIPNYWIASNKILDMWEKITNGKELVLMHPKADVKSNQVDNRCFIWDSCKLSEKTSFKNSTLGSFTEVNSFSRVFNSIVMNNVVIKERVALENCIICEGAVIENNSQIKNCLVGSHHKVPENSEHTNEVLTQADRLMEF